MTAKRKNLFLLCENSGYLLFEKAGITPNNSDIREIPCAGRVEKNELLDLLENEYRKIIIVSCFEGACHYVYGNKRCAKKIEALKKDLTELSLDTEIIEFHSLSANMLEDFREIINKAES
ncbi:MAG: hydrogenase iron-sulfur subunit [Victivallales bacterium]|nr:hydrogenase iron-sulfur subunit [Victivallales bacterium]MCF7888863.1 hydrogenase iron-sulfur subunit [Victivallales bacterium]